MSHSASSGNSRVFISYSHKNKDFVLALDADLKAHGCDTWRDENEIYPGDSLFHTISEGLDSVGYVLAVYSEDYDKSPWAQQEIAAAISLQNNRRNVKVIPLRLDNTKFPTLLDSVLYVDFRGDYTAGLNQLLRGLNRPVAAAPQASVSLPVDRAKLVSVLDGLNAASFARVVNRIEGASIGDSPHLPVPQRALELLAFAESSVGPGLNALASAIVTLFPNAKEKIGPFR